MGSMCLFDDLSYADKMEVLKKAGVPVLVISCERHCITLYLVDDFFVERYYNFETGTLEDIRSASNHDLEKYLNEISIHDLYVRS